MSELPNEEWAFWDKLKYLFSDPNLFFEMVKSETGIKNSLLMYVLVGIFFATVQWGMNFFTYGSLGGGYYRLFFGSYPYWFFAFGLIVTFAYSGIIQLMMRAFKGEGNAFMTYNVYTYSMIPFLIFSVIPFVGSLSIIYSFVLMIIGLSKVHNVSKGKAALACLLPAGVIFLILIGLLIYLLSNLSFGW